MEWEVNGGHHRPLALVSQRPVYKADHFDHRTITHYYIAPVGLRHRRICHSISLLCQGTVSNTAHKIHAKRIFQLCKGHRATSQSTSSKSPSQKLVPFSPGPVSEQLKGSLILSQTCRNRSVFPCGSLLLQYTDMYGTCSHPSLKQVLHVTRTSQETIVSMTIHFCVVLTVDFFPNRNCLTDRNR